MTLESPDGVRIPIRIDIRLRSILSYKDGVHEFRSPKLLVCTLLHELCHCRILGHGEDFRRLWGQLKEEYRELYGDLPKCNGIGASLPGVDFGP